jgi:4-hydroxythreonine-4-phosphate dehydrogenase
MLELAADIVGKSSMRIHSVSDVDEAVFEYGVIDVYHMELVNMSKFSFGKVDAMCGEAAFRCVVKVIELAMAGKIDGTVTNALNKEAINAAGHHYSGHTEIYADLCNCDKYTMMLAHHDMRVVHVSTHVSMREACERCTKERVLDVIRLADRACLDLGIEKPKVGVNGLNPHAGENGLFGREEIEEIGPACEAARAEGIDVYGPLPSDSSFSKMLGGWYDILVCMYHDQGHIPLKVKGFVYNREKKLWDAVEGVNVTLGLPIIRASVDHGTAFGHAGQGVANELSLVNAIGYAARLASNKLKKAE